MGTPATGSVSYLTVEGLPYNGKDGFARSRWVCMKCSKAPEGQKLIACPKCRIARYCSETCIRADESVHQLECSGPACVSSKRTERPADVPEEIWIQALRESRIVYLADGLSKMGLRSGVRSLLRKSIPFLLSTLIVDNWEGTGYWETIPFVLLTLDRYDHCVAFMKFWIPAWEADDNRQFDVPPREWLWVEEGDKYEDLLEVLDCDVNIVPIDFLAALSILKLRIVAEQKGRAEHFEIFEKTEFAIGLGDSLDHVRTCYVGTESDDARMWDQQEHALRYLHILHGRNPTVLPALLNPEPLLRQRHPRSVPDGSPAEAWFLVQCCRRFFLEIPNAMNLIALVSGATAESDYAFEIDYSNESEAEESDREAD